MIKKSVGYVSNCFGRPFASFKNTLYNNEHYQQGFYIRWPKINFGRTTVLNIKFKVKNLNNISSWHLTPVTNRIEQVIVTDISPMTDWRPFDKPISTMQQSPVSHDTNCALGAVVVAQSAEQLLPISENFYIHFFICSKPYFTNKFHLFSNFCFTMKWQIWQAPSEWPGGGGINLAIIVIAKIIDHELSIYLGAKSYFKRW